MTQQQFRQRYTYNPATDKLGEGGFGKVFKAYDTILDRWVAIKIAEVNPQFQSVRLRKEVEMVKKLPPHQNIAYYEECYTFSSFDGEYDFGVLQYYEEGNLLQVMRKTVLTFAQKQTILTQILDGLHFLHSNGIIHRDLKPQNILIVKRGDTYIPKITDFGISKALDINKTSAFSNSLAGAGTLAYASPEQLGGRQIRKNTDLWSFGAIAYQLFTGEQPFTTGEHGNTSEAGRMELFRQINAGLLPDKINDIPALWQQVIRACLVANPDERIKNCAEVMDILATEAPANSPEGGGLRGIDNTEVLPSDETLVVTSPKSPQSPKTQPPTRDKGDKKDKSSNGKAIAGGIVAFLVAAMLVFGIFLWQQAEREARRQAEIVAMQQEETRRQQEEEARLRREAAEERGRQDAQRMQQEEQTRQQEAERLRLQQEEQAQTVSVSNITLNRTSATLTVGNSETLTATILPSNATNRNITWSSSNTSVATVDANGRVTARATGTAAITARTADGGRTATANITVSTATVPVSSISLNRTSATLTVGNSETLTATILPNNATNRNITWSSSNTSVATVDANGRVTARATGTATITARTADGGRTSSARIAVDAPATQQTTRPPSGNASNISTSVQGVVIGGVRWATRNVAAPGTFAANPESAGMFFQWNRRRGWAATVTTVTGWDSSNATGTAWTRANDPCPPGWRVPTEAELRSLNSAGSVWTTRNGVNGRLFGSAPNQIFLPAAGVRNTAGALVVAGNRGFYWSSSADGANSGRYLHILSDRSGVNAYHRAHGFSVRCVAE